MGTFSNAETRSQAQKPARKDPEPKWPKTGHLGSGPLTLRFLSGPVHALCICSISPM
ncbi:alpha-galactosidase [Lacticaseibacillus rhamnosus]|nr:alpha-galactosidase [Lacticaseibacillus rhamnosus]ART97361.1 alpha-galactosidase [Lacticaseibacillus rhamnosus]